MPFSECAPGLRLLPLHKGWRRAEARSFCLPGPSCTLVSKIRSVGNSRSTSSWILCEHSSGCWGGGVTHRAVSNQKQIKIGSWLLCPQSPHGRAGLQVAQQLLQSACFFRTLWKYCIYLCFSSWVLLREQQ